MSVDKNAHYKKLLGPIRPSALEGAGDAAPDLSPKAIDERVKDTAARLHDIVRNYLDDDPKLHQIVAQLTHQGSLALRGLSEERDDVNLGALEAIVRTDGSRPSFLVRNGAADRATSPLGDWGGILTASDELLQSAISCVGRIDHASSPQGFEGTGFLIGRDLILTNRHVLQSVAARNEAGQWEFDAGTAIDFGHEYRARASRGRRCLKRVVYAGPRVIKLQGPVDHKKLDLALIELVAPAAGDDVPTPLAVDIAPDWASPELPIFTIGYPGSPGLTSEMNLLERLFKGTYGYKRLAPGRVQKANATDEVWTTGHDATTLSGNSGSIVVVAGREQIAAGLHYGGRNGEPRENWAHVIGAALDLPDGETSPKTLRERLDEYDVELVDRI